MAGVPFEALDRLATPATAQAARELLAKQAFFQHARSAVETILASREHNLSQDLFQTWRRAVRSGLMPSVVEPDSGPFVDFWESAAQLTAADSALDESLARELETARSGLFDSTSRFLPPYLVFAAEGVKGTLIGTLQKMAAADAHPPPRKKKERARERHLLLYLQRICAKNDTLSEFGPHSWGTIRKGIEGLAIQPQPGIAGRETFLERWTAHGVAAAVNADPETRPELAPRLNPNGRIEGDQFLATATGEARPLDPATLAALQACDGVTPAHSLGVALETLAHLACENLLRWEMEVPALDPYAFDQLLAQIESWREGPVRSRWLDRLRPIAALPARFAATTETGSRIALIDEAADRLGKLGAEKAASRFLYSATNPIGEECFRECDFSIAENLIDEVAIEAAPWIDLWRDNYAFVASRVAAGLRGLLRQTPLQQGAVPLPAFLRHCAEARMDLTGPGLVVLAHLAFQEVRMKFQEIFGDRAELAESALSAVDCQFVRQNFDFPKFDEFTYPSADLQLSAASLEAVEQGDYQWILAELHPPVALLHHGFYWSCPDKEALAAALAATTGGQPSPHFGIFVADFTATTAVRMFHALPELSNFVAPQRAHPAWRQVPPAEVEVFIEEATGDVALRRRGHGEYLGSLARNWIIPLGFHPFSFSLGKNTPRLSCGKVVVQRRTWTIALAELGAGDFTGVSRDLVVAVERLRAQRQLPRHLYIRPSAQALRRSGAEGRDKDTKPVYVDLESYLFLEIFHRWLSKAGELEATEMLPDPEHLLWPEKDGRRTFELRTQIIPR